jgi:CheY-like chemotaxis protein
MSAQPLTAPQLFAVGPAKLATRSLRILVAEDNAVNQKLVTRLLEKRGHRVRVVANGLEAVNTLKEGGFDLVLMDMQMPEMDGFEATAAVRKEEGHSDLHIPIIALTAHAMKGDRERCLAAGMDGYISKPIRAAELDEVLNIYVALQDLDALAPEHEKQER